MLDNFSDFTKTTNIHFTIEKKLFLLHKNIPALEHICKFPIFFHLFMQTSVAILLYILQIYFVAEVFQLCISFDFITILIKPQVKITPICFFFKKRKKRKRKNKRATNLVPKNQHSYEIFRFLSLITHSFVVDDKKQNVTSESNNHSIYIFQNILINTQKNKAIDRSKLCVCVCVSKNESLNPKCV